MAFLALAALSVTSVARAETVAEASTEAPSEAPPPDVPADGTSDAPPPEATPENLPESPVEPPVDALLPDESASAPAPAPSDLASPEPLDALAPSPPSSAPRTLAPPRNDEPTRERGPCLLDRICLGPVLTLGVINPLGGGVHARFFRFFGAGLDYQFLPTLTLDDISARCSLLTLEGRIYPFGGAFFVSAGFAIQQLIGRLTGNTEVGRLTVEGRLTLPMLKLGLGLMGKSGLVIGIDLALHLPLRGYDLSFSEPFPGASQLEQVRRMREDIQDLADKVIGFIPIVPQLNFFRIGYLF